MTLDKVHEHFIYVSVLALAGLQIRARDPERMQELLKDAFAELALQAGKGYQMVTGGVGKEGKDGLE